jgi:hypothetical protein
MVLRCSLRHGASTAHSRETSLQNTEFHVMVLLEQKIKFNSPEIFPIILLYR